MKDVLGTALKAYYFNKNTKDKLLTNSSISEEDELPLDYLLRDFNEMPAIEQKALKLAKGNTLDIGCGAGSHALYLQNKNLKVTAIDISEGAIEVAKDRGIKNAEVANIYNFNSDEKFDTILVLMNGTGICGKLNNLAPFLMHLSTFLNPNGQILIDSSDIIYMYEDENGDHWIDATKDYYGEVQFWMNYQENQSETFDWLYVDYNTLQRCAVYNNLNCELILEGNHYDYLARITKA
ncbi:class I SAM-dependent methyltransferase [Wenyingzhuangia marina]|uniref:Methyltransferase domain-containing protein n=1 Tax=Wenyingzhuangia marina TaxID=1195760 RepID=A0A1M5WGM8_9FLAO|nr:class I SAM-dependent methyltransferase [Wenyingzhuangia marina]GGF81015.1 SAM-dependent methyltransferase [Wenyingzhuangia marina]SHH86652.1 Methyltransferase domain-containing protein [Wenyingzhuangia marina]